MGEISAVSYTPATNRSGRNASAGCILRPMVAPEPLVRGLKRDDRPWCAYVASFLSTAVPANWGTGTETQAAETGLRIEPSIYWYVRRVHHHFNSVVLFHRVEPAMLRADERGACPFDTGALWSGNTIKTGMSDDEKRAYFVLHDRPIAVGLDAFGPWIDRNYGGFCAGYHAGERPSVDIPEIVTAVGAGARWAPWAWEVRVEKARVHQVVRPVGIVWRREDADAFKLWVRESKPGGAGLDDLTAHGLLDIVASIELVCNPRESAYERALRHITEAT